MENQRLSTVPKRRRVPLFLKKTPDVLTDWKRHPTSLTTTMVNYTRRHFDDAYFTSFSASVFASLARS
jgi:hypothetical protein